MTIKDRARLVLIESWRRLPAHKLADAISAIRLADLGAVHGRYHPDRGEIELNRQMFVEGRTIDDQGGEDPLRPPWVSRALHTTIHELAHALGKATGLDASEAWYALSGWEWNPEDGFGTGRYYERRPGWVNGPSPWRYRQGTFFVRGYSAKSPHEDWADCCTAIALGWTHVFTRRGHGRDKLAYINRYLWGRRDGRSLAMAPGALLTPSVRRRRTA